MKSPDYRLEFLRKYNCDTRLYSYVKAHRSAILKRPAPMAIEVSVKTYARGQVNDRRYTITMIISEFRQFPPAIQQEIFRFLGFNIADFQARLDELDKPKNKFTDIILGQDGKLGKIYFDYLNNNLNPHLICFEATGRIKYYRPHHQALQKKEKNGWAGWAGWASWFEICNRLNVFDADGRQIGVHLRVNGDQGVHWYGIAADYTTEYRRPG